MSNLADLIWKGELLVEDEKFPPNLKVGVEDSELIIQRVEADGTLTDLLVTYYEWAPGLFPGDDPSLNGSSDFFMFSFKETSDEASSYSPITVMLRKDPDGLPLLTSDFLVGVPSYSEWLKVTLNPDVNVEEEEGETCNISPVLDELALLRVEIHETQEKQESFNETLMETMNAVMTCVSTISECTSLMASEMTAGFLAHMEKSTGHYESQMDTLHTIEQKVDDSFSTVSTQMGVIQTLVTDIVSFKVQDATDKLCETMVQSATTMANLEASLRSLQSTGEELWNILLRNIQEVSEYNAEAKVLLMQTSDEYESLVTIIKELTLLQNSVSSDLKSINEANTMLSENITNHMGLVVSNHREENITDKVTSGLICLQALLVAFFLYKSSSGQGTGKY